MVTVPAVITVPDVDLPPPIRLIPEMEMLDPDQLQVPAGTVTVSPGLAALIAVITSFAEQEAACRVAALAAVAPRRPLRRTTEENHFIDTVMGEFPLKKFMLGFCSWCPATCEKSMHGGATCSHEGTFRPWHVRHEPVGSSATPRPYCSQSSETLACVP